MSRIFSACVSFLTAFALVAATQYTAADTIVDAADRPWEACGDCHGVDGISATAHFPKLAAQKRAYIEKELRDFHSGTRSNDNGQMSGTRDFSNRALELAAAYFSRLPAPSPAVLPDDEISRAKTIVESGLPAAGVVACGSCHDADVDTVPWLEAQHAGYLAKQLKDFKSGARRNDGAMTDIAKRLSDVDIENIANYLAATPRPPGK